MPEDRPSGTSTVEEALALGLTASEYRLICDHQGGEPNTVELAMYSLLWSEHCAYKHSKRLLGTLPTEGEHVVMGPGENAGAVAVGDGLVCAFKVESHNHPSAVEPFQGAATGVGGILRDIFAIGARPIAVLDSLRFGELTSARSRYLLDGAVAGIGHYGNSIGVPTVGGEVYFEAPYEQNCLVNAMALGLAREDELVRSAAAGVGNILFLFGAATGRDGIGGASVLASAELDEADQDRRPTVQVGDPFQEKKLLECSLELLAEGLLVCLQDLGAAGLTSAAAEMASKGEVGLDLDVARVPLREPDMEPFEIMVSESQERMLCVVEPDKLAAVMALCEKWEVNGAAIGTVTGSRRMRVLAHGTVVGDMAVTALVDDCPLYDLAPAKPTGAIYAPPAATLEREASGDEILLALIGSSNLASRRALFEQYDAIVQSRTVRRPEQADAAVLALPPPPAGTAGSGGPTGSRGTTGSDVTTDSEGTAGSRGTTGSEGPDPTGVATAGPVQASQSPTSGETTPSRPGLAVSIDCNGRRVAADPYRGTVAAVLECASNLACVGATPLGTTNNLNFGNPEKPHVAWQLTEAVRGLGDACRALKAPIVGGNVSLYNEGATAGPIYPTPVIGMVGRLRDVTRAGRIGFVGEGDLIALAGRFSPALGAGELAKLWGDPLPDGLPEDDIRSACATIAAVRSAVGEGLLRSAHDIAEGGLAVALAECCLAGAIGATASIPAVGGRQAQLASLFGEATGGFVISGAREALARVAQTAHVEVIGVVGGDHLVVDAGETRLRIALASLAEAHRSLQAVFT